MHFIQHILNSKAIHALFFTLLHSLWQGIAAALCAGIILLYTKKSSAVFRYKLLGYTLLAFLAGIIVTFYYEININAGNIISAHTLIQPVAGNNFQIFLSAKPRLHFIKQAVVFLKSYEDIIVIIWMIITMLKCIRLLTGLRTIYILKHRHISDAGMYWNNRFQQLVVQAGVTKTVKLLKSAIAEVPMMAGYLKPVILFPAAALTSLSIKEIEAILLHELAHIRRKDYLVNMLQSLIEIMFFFNPAALWISSLIKQERENCCDDIAVQHIASKKQFIHALVAFQSYKINSNTATFFSGNSNYLFNRIKRIITSNNKTLNNMEKIFLSSGIAVIIFSAVAFTKLKQPLLANANHVIQQVKPASFKDRKDTTEPTEINNDEIKTVINNSLNGKHYKLIETNGKIELYVNGTKIPNNKISDYNDVIAKLKQQMVVDKQKQTEKLKAQAEALAAQAESIKANEYAIEDQVNAEKLNELKAMIDDSVKSNLSNEQIDALKESAAELHEQAVKMKDQIKNEISDAEKEAYKAQAEAYAKQAMAMKDEMKSKSVQMQKQELKAQTEYITQQNLMKKAQLDKQMEQLKTDQKKLAEQSEIMKQQQLLMKAEMVKQAEIMKQQQIQMKADMEKQNEQLIKQHEALIKQLNNERDSINAAKPVTPN